MFWFDLLSNSLATILGLIVGIPIAFWVERKLEERRNEAIETQKTARVAAILARIILQAENIDEKLKSFESSNQRDDFLFQYFPEIEVIEASYDKLTELDTEWEVLFVLDVLLADIKALNRLFDIYRNFFAVKMQGRVSSMHEYSSELDKEMDHQVFVTREVIEEFRSSLEEHYPDLENYYILK